MELNYEKGMVYEGNSSRILKCMKKAEAGERIVLAFLGGSITQGSLASSREKCYAYRTYEWWKENFPAAEFVYLNAGIGGTCSHLGAGRVREEVLSQKPDFVIVEFSVNDPDDDLRFQETYEGVIRTILKSETHPAVLLVHNVRYDDGGNAEEIHRPVGAYYGLPSVSMKPVLYEAVLSGLLENREITPDDLHPNDLGHELVAKVIACFLEHCRRKVSEECVTECDTLPEPLTKNAYETAVRYRNDVLRPTENCAFSTDLSAQSGISDCFKKGWTAEKKGAKIVFSVKGSCIAVQYRKTVRRPAPVAELILDGDREHPVVLDANFEENWGDCLFLQPVLEHGEDGIHRVEIEIVQTPEEPAEKFYLVSLIVA